MKLRKIVGFIILALVLASAGYIVYRIIDEKRAWKVEITEEEINVRSKHNLYEAKLTTVKKGETYRVLEIYLKDRRYVWYKIKLAKDKTGWIASGRNNPYVKEINNPNVEDANTGEAYELDYKAPVVKFDEDVYHVYDIKSISYDHITIEDASKYKIEHKVYYEPFPEDSDIPQYWIQYIVTDEAGNQTRKVQKIEFDIEPSSNQVLDFETEFKR